MILSVFCWCYHLLDPYIMPICWSDFADDPCHWNILSNESINIVVLDMEWVPFQSNLSIDWSSLLFNMLLHVWCICRLGLDKIYQLTSRGRWYTVRFDITDWPDEVRFQEYRQFYIDDEESQYTLHIGATFVTAGDGMAGLSGQNFTTRDHDNDSYDADNCAVLYGGGGGWYSHCGRASLNGYGIRWTIWKDPYYFKETLIRIKPTGER